MEGAYESLTPTFCPTDTEIIECLQSAITGSEVHSGIGIADVYSAAPNILVAQHAQPASSATASRDGGPHYFLSPVHGVSDTSKRKSRAVDGTGGKGRWLTEVGRKRVEGTAAGYTSNFSYHERTASGGTTRPGAWLMVEYSIDGCDDLVIAKIYRSSRRQATNVPSSAAVTNKILQEIERKLMSDDDAVDHVQESLQAELANYTCSFPNHNNGNHGALQYAIAGQYTVSGAAATAYGAPQFLSGQYISGAAAAAHYLTTTSPGHADHANKVVLGHNQTVLGARYEVQGQVAQHLITEPVIVVGDGLANLDLDTDL